MSIITVIRQASVLFLCAWAFLAQSSAQIVTQPETVRRPEERFAVLILTSKEIRKSDNLTVSELLRSKLPELFRKTFRGTRNFTPYFKGMELQQESLDGIDVRTVHRVVIWKMETAPITFKTGGERFVVLIE